MTMPVIGNRDQVVAARRLQFGDGMWALARQVATFSAVGLLCAFVDFGLYLSLTRLVSFGQAHYVEVSILTSLMAMTVGFFANGYWTFFKQPTRTAAYGRYLLVYGFGVIWQNSLLALFLRLSIYDWLAKGVAIVVVAYSWNFLLAKFWVFRYTKASPSSDFIT